VTGEQVDEYDEQRDKEEEHDRKPREVDDGEESQSKREPERKREQESRRGPAVPDGLPQFLSPGSGCAFAG